MSTRSNGRIRGARASNAGDEFHVRFAARRIISLLDPTTTLELVRVENAELPVLDDDDFLTIDLTEFYGGTRLEEAKSVVASQLKHRVRGSQRRWTARSLVGNRDGRPGTSVMCGLAKGFFDFTKYVKAKELVTLLTIRLVSNESLNPTFARQWAEIKATLADKQHDIQSLNQLTSIVSKGSVAVIETFATASALPATTFLAFLRVLDLSSCGEPGLAEQDRLLIREAGPLVGSSPGKALETLKGAVRDAMLPDGANHPGFDRDYAIVCLGASSPKDILPMPSLIELPETLIECSDAANIREKITDPATTKLIVHGGPGIGKTTALRAALDQLPEGSVFMLYDGWAGGQCLSFGGNRHDGLQACRQIYNELTTKLGLLPLVAPLPLAQLEQKLADLVREAAALLQKDGRLLVIAVDAADNLQMAASRDQYGQSFAQRLWTLDLPENCRLVQSARTERLSLIRYEGVEELLLTGFAEAESGEHLRTHFKTASDQDVRSFHLVTSGVPRFQAYKINASKPPPQGALRRVLQPGIASLGQLFDLYLRDSFAQVCEGEESRRLLATLVAVTRPFLITDLAQCSDVPQESAEAFVAALSHGVEAVDGTVAIRDEDFDTFLRSKVPEAESVRTHDRIATFLLSQRPASEYGSRSLCDHLAAAERFNEVVKVALDERYLEGVPDAVLRAQIQRRRLLLALRSAMKLNDTAAATKLMFALGRLSKAEYAQEETIRADPELAGMFGDPEGLSKVLLNPSNEAWNGPAHYKLAALCAREGKNEAAKEHLRIGTAWVRRRFAMPENERHSWNFSSSDLAYQIEAVYLLFGPEDAARELARWRPLEFVVDTVEEVFESLAKYMDADRLSADISSIRHPAWADLLLASSLWRRYKIASSDVLDRAARAALQTLPRRNDYRNRSYGFTDLCEARCRANLDRGLTLEVLRMRTEDLPVDLVREAKFIRGHAPTFRALCLRAALEGHTLGAEDILPKKLSEVPEDGKPTNWAQQSDREKFIEAATKMLPDFQPRANALLGLPPVEIQAAVESRTSRVDESWKHRHWNPDWGYWDWALNISETVLLIDSPELDLLDAIQQRAKSVIGEPAFALTVRLAERLIWFDQKPMATTFIERARSMLHATKMPASEKRQCLLDLANVAQMLDQCLAEDLYEEAIQTAFCIDTDSLFLLDSLGRACGLAADRPGLTASRRQVAVRLVALLEMHEPYAGEKKYRPDSQIIDSVAKLWPEASLVTASRWDSMDLEALGPTIGEICPILADRSFMEACDAVLLSHLSGSHYLRNRASLKILDAQQRISVSSASSVAEIVISDVLSNLPEDKPGSVLDEPAERVRRLGIDHVARAQQLLQVEAFAATLTKKDHGADPGEWMRERMQRAKEVLDRAKSAEPEQIAGIAVELAEHSYEDSDWSALATLAKAVNYGSREKVLDSFAHLEMAQYLSDRVFRLFIDLAKSWKTSGPSSQISRKLPSLVAKFLRRHITSLQLFEPSGWSHLAELLELSVPGLPVMDALVVPVLEANGKIGLRHLYALSMALWTTLPDPEWRSVYDWVVAKIDDDLGESSDIYDPVSYCLAQGWAATVAELLFVRMGAPYRRDRWRACCVARDIALRSGGGAFVEALVGQLSATESGNWLVERDEFLWMSARSSLMMTLQRIADENPGLIAPHQEILFKIALSQDLPHAQIRELARLTLESLIHSGTIDLSPDELALVNRPRCCVFPRQAERYRSRTEQAKKKTKYSFNSMDTIPYVYEPAERAFDYPEVSIIERADKWISDVWGRTIEWALESRRRHENDWQDFHSSHGTISKAEDLMSYLEFHGLMCGLGEAADQGLPVSISNWEDPDDPWHQLLARHLPFSASQWIGDSKGTIPPIPELWGAMPETANWSPDSPLSDYLLAVGVESGLGERVFVHADYNASDYSQDASFEIRSVLVSPKTALSFALMVKGSKCWDYRVPMEGDSEGVEKPPASFTLQPYIRTRESSQCLDEFDPRVFGCKPASARLADSIMASGRLSVDDLWQRLTDPDGRVVSGVEWWDNTVRDRQGAERGTQGYRIWINASDLMVSLKQLKKDLVIVVKVARNRHRHYREGEEYNPGNGRAIIIRQDGTICIP